MAQQGASLQNYNCELVKCTTRPRPGHCIIQGDGASTAGLEEMREHRENLNREIAKDEDDKQKSPSSRPSLSPSHNLSLSFWPRSHSVRVESLPGVLMAASCRRIQNDLKILTERLSRINDSLARHVAAQNEYDTSIQETEGAYLKVRLSPEDGDLDLKCGAVRFWRALKPCCMYSNVSSRN